MSTPISAATATRLEKAAVDNGFDRELPREGGWFVFTSTQASLHLWLTVQDDGLFVAAFSQFHVSKALGEHGTSTTSSLPERASAGRVVADIPSLHRMVRRAFQLSRSLPDELLHTFESQVARLPRRTEAERLVIQRVGRGFITVADDRTVMVSPRLSEPDRLVLGLDAPRQVVALAEAHRSYLPWHREHVFQSTVGSTG